MYSWGRVTGGYVEAAPRRESICRGGGLLSPWIQRMARSGPPPIYSRGHPDHMAGELAALPFFSGHCLKQRYFFEELSFSQKPSWGEATTVLSTPAKKQPGPSCEGTHGAEGWGTTACTCGHGKKRVEGYSWCIAELKSDCVVCLWVIVVLKGLGGGGLFMCRDT